MTARRDLIYPDLSYLIRGCAFSVQNELGFGHKESVYQKALSKEFRIHKVNFETEKSLDIFYKDEKVGNYRPDFIIDNKILIEIKAQDFLTKDNEFQLIHYLKSTGFQLGFLINFGSHKVDIRRKIWIK